MLFQAVVIFLPILNFFKFHVKGERSINVTYFKVMYLNGLPLRCRLNFFTLIKCSPGVRGTNEALSVLSESTLSLIGSSVSESGRFRVDLILLKSAGKFKPGMSRWQSHGLPTAFTASAASTMTAKGLPGTSSPDFFTRTRCSPGSIGTNEIPENI